MRKVKGFTLIELLIVVAIIAILAAIAVPNFLEAQVRSKVSRAKSDLRTIATGLEAYFTDFNMYAGSGSRDTATAGNANDVDCITINDAFNTGTQQYARVRITFQRFGPLEGTTAEQNERKYNTLTTPVSFLSSVPTDPFAATKGSFYGYCNFKESGWMLWSYGPDSDETWDSSTPANYYGSQIETWLRTTDVFAGLGAPGASPAPGSANAAASSSVYNPFSSNPSALLITGGYTYDSSNGSTSGGDVWRIRD
jgi:prepilin-type N-terminal cleavage/methylation domain-containing protein